MSKGIIPYWEHFLIFFVLIFALISYLRTKPLARVFFLFYRRIPKGFSDEGFHTKADGAGSTLGSWRADNQSRFSNDPTNDTECSELPMSGLPLLSARRCHWSWREKCSPQAIYAASCADAGMRCAWTIFQYGKWNQTGDIWLKTNSCTFDRQYSCMLHCVMPNATYQSNSLVSELIFAIIHVVVYAKDFLRSYQCKSSSKLFL